MEIISHSSTPEINEAAAALKKGHLVAFPTETVYGLGADALNKNAVARIYEAKGRPKNHPLIVHISSPDLLSIWAKEIPEYVNLLTQHLWPGPITLVLKRTALAQNFITGGQNSVAVRVPKHKLASLLLKEFELMGGLGVVAPSANRFGRVSPTTALAVRAGIGEHLTKHDKILEGGQSIIGVESTIVDCRGLTPRILRPGPITISDINKLCNIKGTTPVSPEVSVRISGIFKKHYQPFTQVVLSDRPKKGEGFIAFISTPTPPGVIRLASPKNSSQYANQLYEALRQADLLKLSRVCVVKAPNRGLGIAVNDRLIKITG